MRRRTIFLEQFNNKLFSEKNISENLCFLSNSSQAVSCNQLQQALKKLKSLAEQAIQIANDPNEVQSSMDHFDFGFWPLISVSC